MRFWPSNEKNRFSMSDPSSCCFTTVRRFFLLPIALLLVVLGSAYRPIRALSAEMIQLREEIICQAQQYVGIRYRYAGVSPTTGFDCSGFTSFILKKFDVNVSCGSSTQSQQGVKVPLSEVMPGDLVFFGNRSRTRIQHVAMVVENTPSGIVCVHSTCTRGIVVENVSTSAYWRPRILFARDVLGRRTAE